MGIFVLILILAHLLADFPFQTDYMIKDKNKQKTLLIHILIHYVTSMVLVVITAVFLKVNSEVYLKLFVSIAIITLLHYMVDFFKEKLTLKSKKIRSSYYQSILKAIIYIFDQIVHFALIIIVSQISFQEEFNVLNKIINLLTMQNEMKLNLYTQIIMTFIVILLNTYFIGYLLGILLIPFKPSSFITETITESTLEVAFSNEKYKDDQIHKTQQKVTFIKDSPIKAGMWIGILERNIIIVLCLMNSISSIGFLIAMKALTRFKQFEDKTFAEYYLIGSMFSIVFAIINGYIIKCIW